MQFHPPSFILVENVSNTFPNKKEDLLKILSYQVFPLCMSIRSHLSDALWYRVSHFELFDPYKYFAQDFITRRHNDKKMAIKSRNVGVLNTFRSPCILMKVSLLYLWRLLFLLEYFSSMFWPTFLGFSDDGKVLLTTSKPPCDKTAHYFCSEMENASHLWCVNKD